MEIKDVVVLLGGIALFLFGMSLMGDGLKKAAGSKLELVLYKLSGTNLKGILLGTGVTAVIQSSSATSVMAVGFVNSGMMNLKQAISVIMGAIIGTSVTGWIICLSELGTGNSQALALLSTESISALAAIAGILIKMISGKKSSKHIADILLGFSVLMFGMKTMSGSVSGLKESEAFISFMTDFTNPLLGILVGAAFTAILQSASAAVGILQALSSTGSISFGLSLPIIMGIAIGASVPVLLAAAGSGKNGKRTALSYLVIEIIRVILFAVLFYGLNAILSFGFMQKTMNMIDIALLNSVFRILTIAIISPFVKYIAKITCMFIKPDKAEEEKVRDINRLEDRFLSHPSLAVEQSRLAAVSMAKLTQESLATAMCMLPSYSEKQFKEVENLEALCDKYEDKLGNYLTKLTAHELNEEQNAYVNQFLRIITDFERMSDHAMNIAESAEEIFEKNVQFTNEGNKELKNLTECISEVLSLTIDSFLYEDIEKAGKVEPLEEIVDRLTLQLKNNHINRLQNGACTLDKGYVFNDLLVNFERVSDHCSNIALSVIEQKNKSYLAHEISDDIHEQHSNMYDKWFEYYKKRYLDEFCQ